VSDTWSLAEIARQVEFKLLQMKNPEPENCGKQKVEEL